MVSQLDGGIIKKDKINRRREVYKKVGKSCGMSIVDYVRKSRKQ